jgi:hypothetical protein
VGAVAVVGILSPSPDSGSKVVGGSLTLAIRVPRRVRPDHHAAPRNHQRAHGFPGSRIAPEGAIVSPHSQEMVPVGDTCAQQPLATRPRPRRQGDPKEAALDRTHYLYNKKLQ